MMDTMLMIVGGWALYALGYIVSGIRYYRKGLNDAGDMITQLQDAYDKSEAKD